MCANYSGRRRSHAILGGVMNLAVIAGLTALVASEKIGSFGVYSTRISGVLLMVSGLWMFLG
jgi:predicted metal-binding membrane protein